MVIADKDIEELARIHQLAGLGVLDAPAKELIKRDGQAAARAILEVFKVITAQIADTTFGEATAKIEAFEKKLEPMRMRMTGLLPLIVPPQGGPLVDAGKRLLALLTDIGAAAVPVIAAELEHDKKHHGLLLLVKKLAEIGDPAALPLLEQLAKEQQEAKNLAEIRGADALTTFVQLAGKNGKEELAGIEEMTVFPALVPFARKHYHKEILEAIAKAIAEIERKVCIQQQIDDRCCKECLVRQNAPKPQNRQPLAKQPAQQKRNAIKPNQVRQ